MSIPTRINVGFSSLLAENSSPRDTSRLVELGHIKDGDKICQDKDTGAFGTKDGLAAFFKFYDDSRAAIPKECDPQEVYFYEYNNHECMIAWDGDKEAYDLIVGYWGEEVAKTIERL